MFICFCLHNYIHILLNSSLYIYTNIYQSSPTQYCRTEAIICLTTAARRATTHKIIQSETTRAIAILVSAPSLAGHTTKRVGGAYRRRWSTHLAAETGSVQSSSRYLTLFTLSVTWWLLRQSRLVIRSFTLQSYK